MTIFLLGTGLYFVICILVILLSQIIIKSSSADLEVLIIKTRRVFFVCLAAVFILMLFSLHFMPECWWRKVDKIWDHSFFVSFVVCLLYLLFKSKNLKKEKDKALVTAFIIGSISAMAVELTCSFW